MTKRFELFSAFAARIEASLGGAVVVIVAETPLQDLGDDTLFVGVHEGAASSEVDFVGQGFDKHLIEATWRLELVIQGGDGLRRIETIENALATCAAAFPRNAPTFRKIHFAPAQYGLEAAAGMAELTTASSDVTVSFVSTASHG